MTVNIFQELHANLPRPCPGSDACTRSALSLVPLPNQPLTILDLGCRVGHQSLVLASETRGQVFAVDGSETALSELTRRARESGMAERIRTFKAPLLEVPFAPETFDLIWSEASVFAVGFERAIQAWKPMLKPGGFMVISELTWKTVKPHKDPQEYWTAAYPAMKSVGGNATAAEQCGMQVVSLLTMPDTDWWTGYYSPLEERVRQFRSRFQGSAEATSLLDIQQWEIDLFRTHSRSYGYIFYIMQVA